MADDKNEIHRVLDVQEIICIDDEHAKHGKPFRIRYKLDLNGDVKACPYCNKSFEYNPGADMSNVIDGANHNI